MRSGSRGTPCDRGCCDRRQEALSPAHPHSHSGGLFASRRFGFGFHTMAQDCQVRVKERSIKIYVVKPTQFTGLAKCVGLPRTL